MTVLGIYSPGMISNTSGWGLEAVTQFVPNPWSSRANPAADVWIQCTPAWMEISPGDINDAGIGILEIEFIDGNGQVQQTAFGDTNDVTNNLSVAGEGGIPTRLYVPSLLSVTVLLLGYNASVFGTVSLFLWG
jgi:hypothetical protein